MKPNHKLKNALIAAGVSPDSIVEDESYGTGCLVIDEEIFAYYEEDDDSAGGNVTYEVEATVELPVRDTIAEIVQDVLSAQNHVWVVKETMRQNGGTLPDGWCY